MLFFTWNHSFIRLLLWFFFLRLLILQQGFFFFFSTLFFCGFLFWWTWLHCFATLILHSFFRFWLFTRCSIGIGRFFSFSYFCHCLLFDLLLCQSKINSLIVVSTICISVMIYRIVVIFLTSTPFIDVA